MKEADVPVDALATEAEALRNAGASVIYLAIDGRSAGLLAVSDPIKASTPEALASPASRWASGPSWPRATA